MFDFFQKDDETFRTNILILGKTGVGKSSLLNYLFGENRALVGDGRPVTGQGIYEHSGFRYNGIDIAIYDSWGLEPDKAELWKGLIERKVRDNGAKDIKDWFHTIIYCVDAKRARLENFEIEHILSPLENMGNRVMFVLTKSDIASSEEKKAMRDLLNKQFPENLCVEVGSVAQKLRNGHTTVQFGRENVFETACINLGENLFCKALIHYEALLREYCDYAKVDVLEFFEKEAGPIGLFTLYDEEFKRNIQETAKDYYRKAVDDATNILEEQILFIGQVIKKVRKAYRLNQKTILAPSFSEDTFSLKGWDNDFWDYLDSFRYFLIPGLFIFRKSSYRDKIWQMCDEATIKILEAKHEQIDEFRKQVCNQLIHSKNSSPVEFFKDIFSASSSFFAKGRNAK